MKPPMIGMRPLATTGSRRSRVRPAVASISATHNLSHREHRIERTGRDFTKDGEGVDQAVQLLEFTLDSSDQLVAARHARRHSARRAAKGVVVDRDELVVE